VKPESHTLRITDQQTRVCKCGAWFEAGCGNICEACQWEIQRKRDFVDECPIGCAAIWDEKQGDD